VTNRHGAVEVAALYGRNGLAGFVLANRWPDDTDEWGELLLVAVQIAAVPGLLRTSTVFSVREEVPDEARPDVIGLVIAEAAAHDAHALAARRTAPVPPGLVVLHPPGERASGRTPHDDVASGCVLLPGLPHLGLAHRAAWAQADRTGESTEVRTRGAVDPAADVDTAVLAMLLVA
jgi:hypothetical protein